MSDGTIEERLLKLEYAPIYKVGMVDRVMVIAKDVTELTRLQAEVARKAEENRRNLELAPPRSRPWIPELFDTFSGESEFLLAMAEALLAAGDSGALAPDVVHELFRVVHTFKGNARMFKLAALQEAAHATEEVLGAVAPEPISGAGGDRTEIRAGFSRVRQTLDELKRPGRQGAAAAVRQPGAGQRPAAEDPRGQGAAAAQELQGHRADRHRDEDQPAPRSARPDGGARPVWSAS